jgi:hypothetical protein
VVRTALNTHVSWWRRRRREQTVDGRTALALLDGTQYGPSADLDLDEGLAAAVRALPARQREVITLRVFFDLDTDATAKLLGISAGTVGAHLHRALAALRALSLSGSPTSGGPAAAHVNLAAWSVNTTSGGKVNVTIRQLKDPARLSQTLAEAGVPVKLTSGRVCTGSSGDLQLAQVVRKLASPRGDVVLSINPAAMPDGTELVIGWPPSDGLPPWARRSVWPDQERVFAELRRTAELRPGLAALRQAARR